MKDYLTVPEQNGETRILLIYETVQNAFYLHIERFLNRKKELCNNIERQRTDSFKLGNILFFDERIH
jgi:hypothetical protein